VRNWNRLKKDCSKCNYIFIHIEAIKVKDEGIVIAKEHLSYIDQLFYQISNHATGVSIGLAIVKKRWSFKEIRLVL
jgi:signal transduction histidine kinase